MVCVPPPKEKVGGRSQGPCATLLATIAAIAPAAPALTQPRLVLALVVSYTRGPETRDGAADQDCQTAPTGATVGVWTRYIFAVGWNVAATLMTSGVVEGEPT